MKVNFKTKQFIINKKSIVHTLSAIFRNTSDKKLITSSCGNFYV